MTHPDKETETLTEALEHFGIENQVNQTIEELAELIQALSKWRRKHKEKPKFWRNQSTPNMAEEIGDVEIMLSQLKLHFNRLDAESKKSKEIKLHRLAEIIKERQNQPTNKKGFLSLEYLHGVKHTYYPYKRPQNNESKINARLETLLTYIPAKQSTAGTLYREICADKYKFCEKTFSRDLHRLEQMGLITRKVVNLSKGRSTVIRRIKSKSKKNVKK